TGLTLPADQMQIIAFSDKVAYDSKGFTSDKTALKQGVLNAGSINGDPYLTQGSTGSATALEKAAQAIASAPSTIKVDNTTYTYQRAVIFVTDGVANVFLDTTQQNNASYIGNSDPTCSNTPYPEENVTCQTGLDPVSNNTRYRPVSQMANE